MCQYLFQFCSSFSKDSCFSFRILCLTILACGWVQRGSTCCFLCSLAFRLQLSTHLCFIKVLISILFSILTHRRIWQSLPKSNHCVSLNVRKHSFLTCEPSEESDQPGHSRSLIRIFTGRILNSQEYKVCFY